MKYLIFISSFIFLILNLHGQENGFGQEEGVLIKTVSLNANELKRLKLLAKDTTLVVNEFNLDSILKKHHLTMNDIRDESEINSNLNNFTENVKENSTEDIEKTTYLINNSEANSNIITSNTKVQNNKNNDDYTINSISKVKNNKTEESTLDINSTKSFSKLSSTSMSQIVFRVQVAASVAPITPKMLKSNYSGSCKVEYFIEDYWYKYIIAEVDNYQDALKIRNGKGVHHAFIAAYYNGEKIDLYNAIQGKVKPFEKKSHSLSLMDKNQGLDYFVQIAACRQPLSINFLNYLNKGGGRIFKVYEEGWYKYRINGGATYSEAMISLRRSCVSDAFIIPFFNGKRITIKEAKKIESEN